MLTQVQTERRKLKASALIDDLKHTSSGMLRFFSDEKIFVQDMKPNRQNNRWLSASLEEVPIVMHSKYPVHVMMLGIISSDGDVMEPVFIPDSIHLGVNSYMRLLDEHVKPWMDMVANGRPYFKRTLLLPTRPGPPRPGFLPMCLITGLVAQLVTSLIARL